MDNQEKEVPVLKPNADLDKDVFPSQTTPVGLSLDRQWYLYEQIQQFCDKMQLAQSPETLCTQDEDKSQPANVQSIFVLTVEWLATLRPRKMLLRALNYCKKLQSDPYALSLLT